MALLRGFADRTHAGRNKRYEFHFLKSPVELRGANQVQSIVLERNRLSGPAHQTRAEGSGEFEELACGLVFRSVGYRGIPIPGLPFDEKRGILPNTNGRILNEGEVVPGIYSVGWIKRGPSGVIGTNKPDSQQSVAALISDAPTLAPCVMPDTGALKSLLTDRGVRIVSFEDWQKIDAAEIERGKPKGKPREKFTRIEEMTAVL